MGILDTFKKMLSPNRLDVSARFELDRHSSSGTMSDFHLAREISTGKVFGLKFLDSEKLEAFESRFRGLKKPSEGEIAVSMDHPKVVRTYEFGKTTSNVPYILMEYLDGTGLNTLIQESDPVLQGNQLSLIRQMADAIEAVHRAGFIHRDICPRNFIVSPDGENLTLIDFGLTVPDQPEFRQPGNRTGTPLYMAPEIVRRRSTDKRVDVFALGVTAFRLCTSEHPWSSGADTTGQAALQHDTVKPKEILDVAPEIDPRLAKAIMQCIESDPQKRPESPEQFARLLHSVTSAFPA